MSSGEKGIPECFNKRWKSTPIKGSSFDGKQILGCFAIQSSCSRLFGDISTEQFENAVVTFEMEKPLPRRERVLRKLVILKKKRRKT